MEELLFWLAYTVKILWDSLVNAFGGLPQALWTFVLVRSIVWLVMKWYRSEGQVFKREQKHSTTAAVSSMHTMPMHNVHSLFDN